MKTEKYYYRDGALSVGPFTLAKLKELLEKGVIDTQSLVRADGSDAWFDIQKVLLNAKIEPSLGNIDEPIENDGYGLSSPVYASDLKNEDETTTAVIASNYKNQAIDRRSFRLREENQGETWSKVKIAPWRRYFARLFDLTLLGSIAWMLIGYVWYSLSPLDADEWFNNLNPLVDMVLSVFSGCFVSGIALGVFGTTPGKLIFGIRVRTMAGGRLSVFDAIQRDMMVYLKGLALGIPLISLITIVVAYVTLKRQNEMSWDVGQYAVYYRRNSVAQILLTILGIVLYVVMVSLINALAAL